MAERRPRFTPENELGAELKLQIDSLKASLIAVTKLRAKVIGDPVIDEMEVIVRPVLRRPLEMSLARARWLGRDIR